MGFKCLKHKEHAQKTTWTFPYYFQIWLCVTYIFLVVKKPTHDIQLLSGYYYLSYNKPIDLIELFTSSVWGNFTFLRRCLSLMTKWGNF